MESVSKLDLFETKDATYKTVGGVSIDLTVLKPQTLSAGKHPVVVRWHGGYLVTGSRMYRPWIRDWLLDLALNRQAILIVPDYRLLPEATGLEILSDVSSLFSWLHTDLAATLSSFGCEADLAQILVVGESAGGYLAVQSALLHPDSGIKAVVSAYGFLDLKTRFYQQKSNQPIKGQMYEAQILADHLHDLKAGRLAATVPAAVPPARSQLALSAVQSGTYLELLGSESELYPMENLTRRRDGEVPAMWLFHGSDDSAVPVASSRAFAEKLKTLHPSTESLLTIEPGEHGFDEGLSIETDWMRNGLDFVYKHWS